MSVRVECNRCNQPATIRSSTRESDNVKKLYCCCNNPECGHSFVVDLSFSHTLSPSALDLPASFLERLRKTSQPQQRHLFSALAQAG